jgi:hypothetical protein
MSKPSLAALWPGGRHCCGCFGWFWPTRRRQRYCSRRCALRWLYFRRTFYIRHPELRPRPTP